MLEWGLVARFLHGYRGQYLCHGCWNGPVFDRIDLEYWNRYPNDVPVCQNCRKAVPAEQLERMHIIDWYFCHDCRSNPDVVQKWKDLQEKAGD